MKAALTAKTAQEAEDNLDGYQIHSTYTEALQQIETDDLPGCEVFMVSVTATRAA